MWKRYGFIGLLVLLGLSYRLPGQNTSAAYDEQLKGAIWTATAQRIWTDTRQKPPAPPLWKASTEFESWINTHQELAGKSELGLLRAAVINRFGKGQPATAPELAQAILTEIEGWKKTGALARVDVKALRSSLAGFTSVAPAPTEPAPTPRAAEDSGQTAAAMVEDSNPAPDLPAEPEPQVIYRTKPATYFGLSPAVAGTLLVLLGAGLGAGIVAGLKTAKRPSRSNESISPSESAISPMQSPEYKNLRQAYDKLQSQVDSLNKELSELKAQLAAYAPAVTTSAATAPVPAPEPTDTDDDLLTVTPFTEAPTEPAPAPAPPATRYGPVQETPFLEDRKLANAPLPQLALMLTIHPNSPDEASFTLNPQVNQSMLIGDGLNRLQKFFDYDPPVGRISSVTAAAPGRLHRQADRWQVVERARLLIR